MCRNKICFLINSVLLVEKQTKQLNIIINFEDWLSLHAQLMFGGSVMMGFPQVSLNFNEKKKF